MSAETSILIKQGSEIKHGGASGAFEEEFLEMERKLEEVKQILAGTDVSVEGLDEIEERLRIIRLAVTQNLYTRYICLCIIYSCIYMQLFWIFISSIF